LFESNKEFKIGSDFPDTLYSQWFKSSEFYPARSSMGVLKLPFNAKIAIECQAYTTKEI
jgi:enamine deaminase RidA (YjgF/YER057c/UK114 family)